MNFDFDGTITQGEYDFSHDIDVGSKIQNLRQILQESESEVTNLTSIISTLYGESRVEQTAVEELIQQIATSGEVSLIRNVPLPVDLDKLNPNEQAGYVVYYLKFLGYVARSTLSKYHELKNQKASIHKQIIDNSVDFTVKRTGEIRLPKLVGVKEIKRDSEAKPSPSNDRVSPKTTTATDTAKSRTQRGSVITPPTTPPRDKPQ